MIIKETDKEVALAILAEYAGTCKWTKGGAKLPPGENCTADGACLCVGSAYVRSLIRRGVNNEVAASNMGHDRAAEALGFKAAHRLWYWNDAPERTFDDVVTRLQGVVSK